MDYSIEFYSESVAEEILGLPDNLAARYVVLIPFLNQSNMSLLCLAVL